MLKVRLSIDKEESSEGSAVPSEVTISGMQKRERKKEMGPNHAPQKMITILKGKPNEQ